jgi:hypothetical protein
MEIRMGSPNQVAQIRWSGAWTLDLPSTDWQDRKVWREDGDAVALVRWQTSGNQPGFRIVVIDCVARTVEISERFPGCCEALAWVGFDTLAWWALPIRPGVTELTTATTEQDGRVVRRRFNLAWSAKIT